MFYISGFYKFKKISNIKKNKKILQKYFINNSIRGTIIISSEGINGTISAKKKNLDSTINQIKKTFKFTNFDSENLSKSKFQPFHRGKIKIKNEVVPMRIKILKRKLNNHTEPTKWNKLINNKITFLIDARKPFEHEVGTFKRAINPNVNNFREFPKYLKNLDKGKTIAMFCTGGIRCEKVSIFLEKKGFRSYKVGQLDFFEQVYLFQNAKTIIGPHGAAFTNLVFCGPKTNVIEIIPDNHPNQKCQRISNLLNLNYIRINKPSLENQNINFGDMLIDKDELNLLIKDLI